MEITILSSSRTHPIWPSLVTWAARASTAHTVRLAESLADVTSGHLLFLISCSEIVRGDVRGRFEKVLVIHASDVPDGRGFAPLNWQILQGRSEIVVTLMEAAGKVDSGDVWRKKALHFAGHELFGDLCEKLFAAELELMDFAVDHFRSVTPQPQPLGEGSYFRQRTPQDSRIQPTQTIAEIFDLIRASDPDRYPVFFDHRGCRYALYLEKLPPSR